MGFSPAFHFLLALIRGQFFLQIPILLNRDETNQILPAACGDHSQRRAGRRQWYPIYDIEFKTDYGDYNFEVAIADGRIVGADYEVDEECLVTLGGSPVTVEEAAVIVAGKVPGADAADVSVWEESENGRDRCEGELFFEDMKYEFEIDPQTGKSPQFSLRRFPFWWTQSGSNRRPYGCEQAPKTFFEYFRPFLAVSAPLHFIFGPL